MDEDLGAAALGGQVHVARMSNLRDIPVLPVMGCKVDRAFRAVKERCTPLLRAQGF